MLIVALVIYNHTIVDKLLDLDIFMVYHFNLFIIFNQP